MRVSSRVLGLAVYAAFLALISSARADPSGPSSPELPSLTTGNLLVVAGTVALAVAQATLSFFQWRIARAEKDDKADLIKANVLTLAERDEARNNVAEREKIIADLEKRLAATEDRFRSESGVWSQEKQFLLIRLARLTPSSDDISTITPHPGDSRA